MRCKFTRMPHYAIHINAGRNPGPGCLDWTRLPTDAIVGLDGPLGAGKTCMAQGIAHGWGLPEDTLIASPAYNLVLEYDRGLFTLAHIDFYRLDRLSRSDIQLFAEILERPDTLVVVEWAGKFLQDLVPDYLSICINRPASSDSRQIIIRPVGESTSYTTLINQVEAYAHSPD